MENTIRQQDAWNDGPVFNRSFSLKFDDCDVKKEGSLYTIMKLMSEMAGEDYERRHVGYDFLFERNQVFILSQSAMRFHRLPRFGENIVISTWEKEIRGPLLCRAFDINTIQGEHLGGCMTGWLLVNPVTRDILRPTVIGDVLRPHDGEVRCGALKKLRRNPNLTLLGERPVYFSDLDGNEHVNNAVYGKIAVDFLPDDMRRRGFQEVYITFNKETRFGSSLSIFGGETEIGYEIQGSVDGQLHFATEFIFAK